jgi:hypothetical protein
MPPKAAQRVDHVAPQHVEVLAWCTCDQIERRAEPEKPDGTRLRSRLPPLVLEVGGHLLAEVAPELGGKEAQQRAE